MNFLILQAILQWGNLKYDRLNKNYSFMYILSYCPDLHNFLIKGVADIIF